jgi:hypothetical protein
MRSGVPDQKGVLGMIRRLPEYHLSPGNNKGWHGTVALHFWFFLTEPDDPPLQQDKNSFIKSGAIHHKGKKPCIKKKICLRWPVPQCLDQDDHLFNLFFLLSCQFPVFLDQPAHPDNLQPLIVGERCGMVCPLEKIEPLFAIK